MTTVTVVRGSRWSGYLLILVAAALWGMIGPVSRYALAEGVTPLEVAFWRSTLAWFLFGGHALFTGAVHVRRPHMPAVALFGIVCVALFYGAYQGAVEEGGAALASVLLYTAPAWVALLARALLGERITPAKVVAIAITLFGVALVAWNDPGQSGQSRVSALAISLGLLSGFTYSLYYLFGKTLLRSYATPTLFLYALPVGALALYPWITFVDKSATAWASLVFVAVVSTYLAYLAYYAGLRHLEATRAAVVATIEPVVAALLAWFWWDERFGVLGWLGSAAILGSVLLIVFAQRQAQSR
ncbi:MAG: DMT family transporter [Gammaproteobacteria bacterium]